MSDIDKEELEYLEFIKTLTDERIDFLEITELYTKIFGMVLKHFKEGSGYHPPGLSLDKWYDGDYDLDWDVGRGFFHIPIEMISEFTTDREKWRQNYMTENKKENTY